MKLKNSLPRALLVGGLIGTVLAVSHLQAQAVFTVPGATPRPLPARPGLGGPRPVSNSGIDSAFASVTPLVKWAAVTLHPSLTYTLQYSDGLLRVPGEPVNTTVQTLGIALPMEIGKHWALDYAFGYTWNSSRLLADYATHRATISGHITRDAWSVSGFQSYSTTKQTRAETGQQTPQDSYGTGGSASYEIGPRSLIDVRVTRTQQESDLQRAGGQVLVPKMEQWSFGSMFHYQVSNKIELGAGWNWGYDSIASSADMRTSQPTLSIEWHPTQRLFFSANGGIETRTFKGSDDDLTSSVYSVSGSYQPTTTTTLSVGTSRTISPSYFINQVSRTTGYTLNLQQRFLQRFFFTAAAAEGNNNYVVTTAGGFPVDRKDKFDSLRFGLSTPFAKRGSVGVTYETSTNDSSDQLFEYTNHTYGLDVSFRF